MNKLDVEARFETLLATWRRDNRFLSYTNLEDKSLRSMVAMGKDILPYVFHKLESNSNDPHWILFDLLTEITGEDPVPKEHYGYNYKIGQDWLSWGIEHGYVEREK